MTACSLTARLACVTVCDCVCRYLPAKDAFNVLKRARDHCSGKRDAKCGQLEFRGLVDMKNQPCCGFGFKLFHSETQACELDILVLAASPTAPLVHQETWLWPSPLGPWWARLKRYMAGSRPDAFWVIPEDVANKQIMASEANWDTTSEWSWRGAPVSFFHSEYFAMDEFLPLETLQMYDFSVNVPANPWAS